jgi:hypothetical protein
MWARLDDQLIDHPKLFEAGALLGKNGPGLAFALYSYGLMYANKHLTDGELKVSVVKACRFVDNPASVADALVKAGLWEKNGVGYLIHDFGDFNPRAKDVLAKRAADRRRKIEERAGKHRR